MLRRNVGGIDRALRVTFGAILVFGGLLLVNGKESEWRSLWSALLDLLTGTDGPKLAASG